MKPRVRKPFVCLGEEWFPFWTVQAVNQGNTNRGEPVTNVKVGDRDWLALNDASIVEVLDAVAEASGL